MRNETPAASLEAIRDIKQMMEKSSRFISLSGLSGISAGVCALAGACAARATLSAFHAGDTATELYANNTPLEAPPVNRLLLIAGLVLAAALCFAFLFTYLRSRKTGVPLWGRQAQRLLLNLGIPLFIGGVFVLKLVQYGSFGLVAPACLIFYGLALLNASKYTLAEVRQLAIAQLLLGLLNLWYIGYGLYFWAAGFGIAHIVYGMLMWWKYEKKA
jgi:hypothetical protein